MPGVETVHTVTSIQHQLSIASDCGGANREGTTPYQRLLHALHNDAKWLADVNLGKRVGFYRFRGDLGSGNFSQVKMAVHQLTREAVAIKILDKSKLDAKTRKMLSREISTMESIHHPNIIRLYEVVETYSKIHLVMEYASGGELFNKITTTGRLGEDEAKPLFGQVVSAVKYMHEHNFIHRDIKAENVFYSGPGLVKLGDFGFSTQLTSGSGEQLRTFCGSPPYAAPELFRDDSYLGGPVDIWALGVLLYFVVSAQMPFKAQTVAALKQHILQGLYSPAHHVTPECSQLIEGILKQPPRERLSLDKIISSDWLRDTPIPSQPGPYENYILTPTWLPRRCSTASLNGLDISPVNEQPKTIESLQNDDQNSSPKDNDSKVSSPNRKQNGSNADNGVEHNLKAVQDKLEAEYRRLGMTEIEIRAREKLEALGLTAEMLEEHSRLGAKSAIIGAYRILIHRVQKAESSVETDVILMEDGGGSRPGTPATTTAAASATGNRMFLGRGKSKSASYKTKNGTKVLQRNRSKTCVII